MKKPFICLCAGVMLFALAGCTTDYVGDAANLLI
ncbi:YgdI/YgdR family lipoprotein [Citrobacter freundii]|nr:YgdI/YgdR family lipoprotein [Citrobacter freundii]